MGRISDLPDELLVKILSYLPTTKLAVSTSVLTKQWKVLWIWVPKIKYDDNNDITVTDTDSTSLRLRYLNFIAKNLSLHKAPVIDSLSLKFHSLINHENIKPWVDIAVSRFLRKLSIALCLPFHTKAEVILPSSLYTCKSLVTLKLKSLLLVVPETVCLPSLKTLHLRNVICLNGDSLRLLLSYCHVLEYLVIQRFVFDNVKALVIIVPSLRRLTLMIGGTCPNDEFVIATPSLKYFKVADASCKHSYSIERMPKLEEADINVMQGLEKLLGSVTSVKRLSLGVFLISKEEYCAGIVFDQLEHLELCIDFDSWSKLLFRLLTDSPKMRVLSLYADGDGDDESVSWINEESSVPECLSKSLEILEFTGYNESTEEDDFLRFLFKNARCLKSWSVLP